MTKIYNIDKNGIAFSKWRFESDFHKRGGMMEIEKIEKKLLNVYSKETCYPKCRDNWNDNNKTLCMCIGDDIAMVIPYNNDTKHLIGTTDEAPEFYKYWEN